MENIKSASASTYRMKCLIVDDEPVAIDGLIFYINKLDFLEVSHTCFSAIEAENILKSEKIDLMFLDINLPALSGIDFLSTLQAPPLTILTTAYSEYALEGYRLNVTDYLLKPISFQRFFQAVSKAKDYFNSRLIQPTSGNDQPNDLFIKQGDSYIRLLQQDILYLEGMQNYVKIHTAQQTFIVHQTMTSMEQSLPAQVFFRTHKSYIVNTSHISSISGNRLFIAGKELPLSPTRKEELFNRFINKKLL